MQLYSHPSNTFDPPKVVVQLIKHLPAKSLNMTQTILLLNGPNLNLLGNISLFIVLLYNMLMCVTLRHARASYIRRDHARRCDKQRKRAMRIQECQL